MSIVVPCYNQGEYLSDALESVLNQSFTNWECIIVNDGSTDSTESVVNTFCKRDSRFLQIKTSNSGLSSSRNRAIKTSKGKFIQFLDADDLLENNKLKHAVEYYLSGFDADKSVVYASMRYFEDGEPENLKIMGRDLFIAHVEMSVSDSLQSQKEVMVIRNPFVISASLYPKGIFEDVGYFDETLTALEDWDLHIRCNHSSYKFHHLGGNADKTLIRLHDKSMMRNQKLLDENYFKLMLKFDLWRPTLVKSTNFDRRILKAILPPFVFGIYARLKRF